ncbi:hypothetical protein CMV_019174 [Castanea mollissima]|uniref:Uncharacterized protein n=1 Tax=Castanea mollissima TaxID=60419 RepID=A0A8J4QT07_9ROSI|nr:hypothetical protein CMV_019174 [Castanea mollissima]
MPHSCIRLEKLFKQGRQYNNLKSINLGRLFNQFLEISMDPSFWDYDRCKLILPRIEIPKGFKLNHQSVGNSTASACGSSSVPDDIDHHSFPSDVGLQMDTTNGLDLPMGHPSLGFTYGLDDQDSSTIARICDNTEPPPLPAIFSTPYGSDLDHGVSNTGGVSGLLIDPNFESSFHDDVHDLDSSSIAYPFARIGYLDSNASIDGFSPLVLDDIEHHSLPSDVRPVDTTNGSELSLGRQDQGSSSVAHAFDNNNFDFNLFPPSKKARTS